MDFGEEKKKCLCHCGEEIPDKREGFISHMPECDFIINTVGGGDLLKGAMRYIAGTRSYFDEDVVLECGAKGCSFHCQIRQKRCPHDMREIYVSVPIFGLDIDDDDAPNSSGIITLIWKLHFQRSHPEISVENQKEWLKIQFEKMEEWKKIQAREKERNKVLKKEIDELRRKLDTACHTHNKRLGEMRKRELLMAKAELIYQPIHERLTKK